MLAKYIFCLPSHDLLDYAWSSEPSMNKTSIYTHYSTYKVKPCTCMFISALYMSVTAHGNASFTGTYSRLSYIPGNGLVGNSLCICKILLLQ